MKPNALLFLKSRLCLLVFAVVLPAASGAEPGGPAVPIPAAADLLAGLTNAHPRLLASADDMKLLKARMAAEPQWQSLLASVRKEGEDLLKAEPVRYEIPDGLRLLETSRRVVRRIYTLGFLYRLEGDRRFADRAWKELETAAGFKDWNPRHFLDTAEMTHAFAIGYDWFYEVWTPEQRATLRQALVEKGFKPALAVYRSHGWWSRARHNWNQVCNGGLALGALALGREEAEMSGEILKAALESVQLAMAEFAPDGAWNEGPGYWSYATTYNVVLLAGLQSALGTDFGLSQMPAFGATGLFPIYVAGPTDRTFNYADGGDHAIRAAQLFWFARQFKEPVCAWYQRQGHPASALDLLWFDSSGAGPKAAGLPLDKYYRGAEVATLRSEWEDAKALFVGFKAGDNKANHSHLDLGSFVLDALGERWAVDLGADNYNLPGYFGSQRWEYYRLRAEGHNTLVINPSAKPDQDPTAATRILRFGSKPERAFALADLTPAYAKQARKVWRGIALLDRHQVLVQDEIQTDQPAEIWWFMHTAAQASLADDSRSATLRQGGAELQVRLLSPADARFQVLAAEPLPASVHPQRQARNNNIRKLTIHLAGAKDARLAVLLLPSGTTQQIPQLSLLSEWK